MGTLLVEPDTAQDSELVFNFAPGKGNKPLGTYPSQQFLVENVELITSTD